MPNTQSDTIWYPYTQALTSEEPITIEKAKDALLYTNTGETIIDAISSWWVTLHGHRNPLICEAVKAQLDTMEHVILADFTHKPAKQLAKKLLKTLPEGFSKVFYSDNGSTAVETALKAAFQYWHNDYSSTKRKKVLAFCQAYHGDTFGAMSVSERGRFTTPFLHALFDVTYINPPMPGKEDDTMREVTPLLQKGDVACFIFEPIIQGVAGMKKHSAEGLDQLIALCRKYEVLTIADEVMTGFGRLGPAFATTSFTNTPDMICLSKGITGGFLPLGATVFTEKIYEKFLSKERSKAFLHGHSYCGNPLACAAGIASLDQFNTEECTQQRKNIEEQHNAFLQKWKTHPKIADAHVTGTILAITYATREKNGYYNSIRDQLCAHFRAHNVLLRPLGNTIYVLPPYCITNEQLSQVYHAIEQTLALEEK